MAYLYFKRSSGCLLEKGLQGTTIEAGKRPARVLYVVQTEDNHALEWWRHKTWAEVNIFNIYFRSRICRTC